VVDTSLFETAMGWLQVMMAGFSAIAKQPERHRSGNPRVVVFQAFAASDGEVVIAAANDRLFNKLGRELGHPEWADDPRFASNALRVQHKADIVPVIAAVLATRPMQRWIDRLEAIGVPCAPIHDFQQVVDQPQTHAIGIFQTVPEVELRIVGLPISFDGMRPPVKGRAPEIGEHRDAIRSPRPAPGN